MIFFSFRSLVPFLFLSFIVVLVQAASILKKHEPGYSGSNHHDRQSSNPVEPLKKLFKEEGRNLARIDATLKSYLGNPLTGIVYAASLAIGAISLLAMYESPLSPLPVPSLPKPPVGRFPPEHPVWPPVPKHPVKLRQQGSLPSYAASNLNPVYELAPQFAQKQQLVSYETDNNWLSPQNLVQAYGAQASGLGSQVAGAVTGSALAPPRRSDYTIQPYLSKMHLPLNNWKQQPQQQQQQQQQQQASAPSLATPSQPAQVGPSDAVVSSVNDQAGGSVSNPSVNQEVNNNSNPGIQGSTTGIEYNIQPEQQN